MSAMPMHDEDADRRARADRDTRLVALLQRAARRRCAGSLLTALSSGLLSGDPAQTETLFSYASALEADPSTRRRAVTGLLALARIAEPGALTLLGWLEDERSRERLAGIIGDASTASEVRTAALRGALHILRLPQATDGRGGQILATAVRRAVGDRERTVRYTAAFVCASLGQRDVRGALERGALEESDATLLRLCLLGIDRVGDSSSLPFVWRVWMRHPSLRDLADAVCERLEEDLRRRRVNLLADPAPAPAPARAPSAPPPAPEREGEVVCAGPPPLPAAARY